MMLSYGPIRRRLHPRLRSRAITVGRERTVGVGGKSVRNRLKPLRVFNHEVLAPNTGFPARLHGAVSSSMSVTVVPVSMNSHSSCFNRDLPTARSLLAQDRHGQAPIFGITTRH